jgi:hypothetical protein
MNETSAASLWNTDSAYDVAWRIASLRGVYCGPAAVAWIAAVWNAFNNIPYPYLERLQNKTLFPDGPRAFSHSIPGFKIDLEQTLLRETQDALKLSRERVFTYAELHRLLGENNMPIIVRIPTASIRDGLHYVTLFKSVFSGTAFRFYWQDNGVFRSDEHIQNGISVSVRKSDGIALFPWGARQVVRA